MMMFLSEIGDLNNIRPYAPIRIVQTRTGAEATFDADGHPVVVTYTMMNDRISSLTSPPPGLTSLVNVGFTVDGNESQIVGSNFSRAEFNRIFRTVRDTAMDFITDVEPDMMVIASTVHPPEGQDRTEDQQREERVKLDAYEGAVETVANNLERLGYNSRRSRFNGHEVILIFKTQPDARTT
jgi:hypothetical protein